MNYYFQKKKSSNKKSFYYINFSIYVFKKNLPCKFLTYNYLI